MKRQIIIFFICLLKVEIKGNTLKPSSILFQICSPLQTTLTGANMSPIISRYEWFGSRLVAYMCWGLETNAEIIMKIL